MTTSMRIFAFFSLLLLLVGVFAPTFEVTLTTGDPLIDGSIVEVFPGILGPNTFSIYSSVGALYTHGEVGLATVILAFSVLFPIAKLILLWVVLEPRMHATPRRRAIADRIETVLLTLGHWSMLDVLVIAVLVVGFKELPGGSHITWRWGIWCFTASVLLSLSISSLIWWKGRLIPASIPLTLQAPSVAPQTP